MLWGFEKFSLFTPFMSIVRGRPLWWTFLKHAIISGYLGAPINNTERTDQLTRANL